MLTQVLSLLVQVGNDGVYTDVAESYDSIAELIKLFLGFIAAVVIIRLIALLAKRSSDKRETEAKLISMKRDMQKIAREKIEQRKSNGKELEEAE